MVKGMFCSVCTRHYESSVRFCSQDGTRLIASDDQSTLVGDDELISEKHGDDAEVNALVGELSALMGDPGTTPESRVLNTSDTAVSPDEKDHGSPLPRNSETKPPPEEEDPDGDDDTITLIGDGDAIIPDHAVKVVVHNLGPDVPATDNGPANSLEIGDMVGEYQVKAKLGAGGMAEVFRAEHSFSSKPVAIKLLNPRVPAESEAVERFIQEARAVQMIGHRNIIDIISFERLPSGQHYFVLEYLDGLNLRQYGDRYGPLTLAHVLPILRPVANALDAAHTRGIVHRDLKPENIFVERPDQPDHMFVKLLDFGAATLVESERSKHDQDWLKTKDGVLLGTPDYMSPEQCQGHPTDQRTDVYSLGVVAYQLLVGELPFGTGEAFKVMARRLMGKPLPPSEVSPKLSPALDEPLLTALADAPEDRYQTAGAFVNALEALLKAPGPAHSRPLDPPAPCTPATTAVDKPQGTPTSSPHSERPTKDSSSAKGWFKNLFGKR